MVIYQLNYQALLQDGVVCQKMVVWVAVVVWVAASEPMTPILEDCSTILSVTAH